MNTSNKTRRIYATATLRQLIKKRIVKDYLLAIPFPLDPHLKMLKELLASSLGLDETGFSPEQIQVLEANFLIQRSTVPVPSPGRVFRGVTAINFELTYGCSLACSHCLQDSLRPPISDIEWLKTSAVFQALADGKALGLFDQGVNFTGGEIYVQGSPILEMISRASELGIRVRSNTNGWWGNRTSNFKIGSETFSSDQELILHLKKIGLGRLVLSLDNRYEQYPNLLNKVIRIAELCEMHEQHYEFVATDAIPFLIDVILKIRRKLGKDELKYLTSTVMDTVDIGAAGDFVTLKPLNLKSLPQLVKLSPCRGKGFYLPYYLHINPDGGVRSCLYAPGAEVLGNIETERLPEILNRADQNAVVRLFSSGENVTDKFVEENIKPWQHIYRRIEHSCTASAMIARLTIGIANKQQELGRVLTETELESLHKKLAKELNLGA
jgi:MoaA/NifB/PqqE/SkfB family radical SAM enzyme